MPASPLAPADYEEVVRSTRPILYVPFQSGSHREVVRGVALSTTGTLTVTTGPFPGTRGISFGGSSDETDVPTNAAYHPGDTFSVGGWFNRTAAGESSPAIVHAGANDMLVYFPNGDDGVSLRKAGVADIFTTTTKFASPYTAGWQHVIFAKNAGTSTVCYLNGASAAGTFSNQTIVASSTNICFGGNPSGATNNYGGALAHWAIWDRVLTEGEARLLYQTGRLRR